jgi:hypothetical protein
LSKEEGIIMGGDDVMMLFTEDRGAALQTQTIAASLGGASTNNK